MKKNKLFYLIFSLIFFLIAGGVYYRHFSLNKSYQAFLNQYHLEKTDISFAYKGIPVGGNGFIFYQAYFPDFKIRHKIDKLIIKPDGENITVQMQGIHINILQTLRDYYGQDIITAEENYHPFEAALSNPLISLGVMGIFQLKGDIVFVFNPNVHPLTVNAQISLPNLAEIQLSFPILNHKDKNLIYSLLGKVPEISVELMNNGLFQKYADYLKEIGQPENEPYQAELLRQNNFIRLVHFQEPVDLKLFYQKKNKTNK